MSIAVVLSVNECLYFQNLVGFLKDHDPIGQYAFQLSTCRGQA